MIEKPKTRLASTLGRIIVDHGDYERSNVQTVDIVLL